MDDPGDVMRVGQEISVEIEEGKTLFIRLVNVNPVDQEAKRAVIFELNGMTRQLPVTDRSVQPKVKPRTKADPAVPAQIGAPIPGLLDLQGAPADRQRPRGALREVSLTGLLSPAR